MNLQKSKPNYRGWLYLLLITITLITVVYLYFIDRSNQQLHANITHQIDNIKPMEISIGNDGHKLFVTDQSIFTDQGAWSYVGPTSPYHDNYQPTKLVDIPVNHSKDQVMQISHHAAQPLKNLFVAAQNNDHQLIIASAYRSIKDQTALYQDFTDRLGADLAKDYVANPGSSEHHSGLSVDIDDYSADCQTDSDSCYLSLESANWLATNAPKYGFILRYPEGKQPITGMTYEAWHYRYVGTALATALTDHGLTFDEFIAQSAPGRIK